MDTIIANSMGGYPLGASDDPRAPYNQKDPEKVKVKVTVSVTYHKDFEVEVEEGYSNVDLRNAIEEMDVLPNTIISEEHSRLRRFLKINDKKLDQKLKNTLIEKRDRYKPWIEDELEVFPSF